MQDGELQTVGPGGFDCEGLDDEELWEPNFQIKSPNLDEEEFDYDEQLEFPEWVFDEQERHYECIVPMENSVDAIDKSWDEFDPLGTFDSESWGSWYDDAWWNGAIPASQCHLVQCVVVVYFSLLPAFLV